MNYPLAFQNNSTIFANETNLSYFSTPRPLSAKIGGVLLPETFSRKKFPKFFPPKGRLTFCYIFGAKNYVLLGELFSVFSVRKIMRVRGTCRSANRGGWLFYALSAYSKGLPSCPPSSSPVVNFQPIGANFRQKVAKVNNFLVRFGVFSGKSETKNGKSEIYFGFGAFVVLLSSSFVVAVVVSTGCRWCAPAPSLWVCSVPFLPAFALFPAFLSRFAFRICPYLAFLGGF